VLCVSSVLWHCWSGVDVTRDVTHIPKVLWNKMKQNQALGHRLTQVCLENSCEMEAVLLFHYSHSRMVLVGEVNIYWVTDSWPMWHQNYDSLPCCSTKWYCLVTEACMWTNCSESLFSEQSPAEPAAVDYIAVPRAASNQRCWLWTVQSLTMLTVRQRRWRALWTGDVTCMLHLLSCQQQLAHWSDVMNFVQKTLAEVKFG